jgi:hypothetical protein
MFIALRWIRQDTKVLQCGCEYLYARLMPLYPEPPTCVQFLILMKRMPTDCGRVFIIYQAY